jgi:glycosyltransferase involved in cell wall biosynthesis
MDSSLSASYNFNPNRPATPKVTIGFCVRNSEDSITEAVESVLAQNFPHAQMEIVFVDDGSDDGTLSTIKKIASKSDLPARIYHTNWKGVGNARNVVITHTQSQYIIWVDGDMVLAPGYIKKLVDFMDANHQFAITKGRQGLKKGANLLATTELMSRAAGRMIDYTSERNRYKALGTGGSIYRTEALKQAGRFDPNLRGYGEDQDLELRIKKYGWKLTTADVTFQDYERQKLTWKNLYRRYYLRGYFSHYFLHKNPGVIRITNMLPPMAFIAGLFQAQKLFRITHIKSTYLVPFHNALKMLPWYIGFIDSHLDSYQPR